jgi:site-specific DNA-cytosine methylase
VLDLCSGTKSIGKAIKRIFVQEYEVVYVSVDSENESHPTFCVDIRKWDFGKELTEKYGKSVRFDIIWASPPCTEYSLAKSTGVRDFKTADAIVKKCLEIIGALKPRKWYMENPSTGHLHKRAFMRSQEGFKNKCCYCRYGRAFKKPTHIWTNVRCALKVCTTTTPCKWKSATNSHPLASQKGPNVTAGNGNGNGLTAGIKTIKAYEIPHSLLRELFTCEELL